MKFKSWALSGLLLLCCQISLANAVENTLKPVDTLPDSTVATEKQQPSLPLPSPDKTTPGSDAIKDPTSMNENFRTALNRLDKKTPAIGTVLNSPTAVAPSLPNIKLLAAACEHHKEKNHAMLSVNGKSEMVGFGDKITAIVKDQVVEIEVMEIQKNHVRIRLHPNNEIIILR